MAGGIGARTIPGPRVAISFQPAMQVIFEDKTFALAHTVGQGVGAIRKVTCDSLATPALELSSVTCEPGNQPLLGCPGVISPKSQHVFAIRPGTDAKSVAIR